MRVSHILLLIILATVINQGANCTPGSIHIGRKASRLEQYAAKELQRYLYQLTGKLLEIRVGAREIGGPSFVIGQPGTNPLIRDVLTRKAPSISPRDPGPEGYVLKKLDIRGKPVIAIAANDPAGCLYGTYGLLADYYHVGFFLGGDVVPDKRSELTWVDVDERKTPAVSIRGFLPWTNFPQSSTVYSWEDWKFILDQMAKMRMNFLHIHNYNGELGHNEMYHNFSYNGFTSRVWMATARTGHKWACPGWDVKKYQFGASDLFDDYDFGADCALHNENLSSEEVFRKSASLFARVIAYAHERGVKIGLGLDIDLIPPEYKVKADDPEVIRARVDQLAKDYPDLDYLLCFQSENVGKNPEFFAVWRRTFLGFYQGVKSRMPRTRVAVSGWGLDPGSIAELPRDVICAPIAYYSDRCESGAIYGEREYWGCPWLERDFNSSEYYYPYNIHLSNTIEAYRNRAPNMRGFYCLTWRLTDAIDPKIYYMSRAPWDMKGVYSSSRAVYREYAATCYGNEAADDITSIIDQNEPFASDFGECQSTPPFSKYGGRFLLNLSRFELIGKGDLRQASRAASDFSSQEGIEKAGSDEGGDCIGYINHGDWVGYRGVHFGEGTERFEARVASAEEGGLILIHIDSLAGAEIGRCEVGSTHGWQKWVDVSCDLKPVRGIRDLYLAFAVSKEPPSDSAKAVEQLAVIDRWISAASSPQVRERLRLLRRRIGAEKDHIELNSRFDQLSLSDLMQLAGSWVRNFTRRVVDISSLGNVMSMQNRFIQLNYVPRYEMLRNRGEEESPPARTEPGFFLAVISPPTSVSAGQYADIKVRALDAHPYDLVSARLMYRAPGEERWKGKEMLRRTKAVFAARISSEEIPPKGLEYYIQVSCPDGQAVFPPGGHERPLSMVMLGERKTGAKPRPPTLSLEGQALRWEPAGKNAYWYRIYRGADPNFVVGPENYLTYVEGGSSKFIDNGEGFGGMPLSGIWYYCVASVDAAGIESPPSNRVAVPFPEVH